MIVACHCDGKGWKVWGDSTVKSKFWGQSIQLDPVGILTLEFEDGEVFQWSKVRFIFELLQKKFSFLSSILNKNDPFCRDKILCLLLDTINKIKGLDLQVTTSIHNLILGKLYCDHYGTMRIQGNRELSCRLKFKEQSIIDRNPHQVLAKNSSSYTFIYLCMFLGSLNCFGNITQVQGFVHDKSGQKLASLLGKWDESMHYVLGDLAIKPKGYDPMTDAVLLWERNKPSKFSTRYNLTSFAITLNELTPGLQVRYFYLCNVQ